MHCQLASQSFRPYRRLKEIERLALLSEKYPSKGMRATVPSNTTAVSVRGRGRPKSESFVQSNDEEIRLRRIVVLIPAEYSKRLRIAAMRNDMTVAEVVVKLASQIVADGTFAFERSKGSSEGK